MPLTAQQQDFVDAYLEHPVAGRAACKAGYSERSSWSIGCRMLKDPDVAAAIAAGRAARAERTKIDQDYILRRLVEESEANLADLYDEDGLLLPVHEWPDIWQKGLVAGVEVEERTVEGKTVATVKKIKLSDRIKRLELIGKHVDVQAFRDQVDVNNRITNKSDDELLKELAELRRRRGAESE